jgi:hypothetical protein
MARQKRGSQVLVQAEQRAAGLTTIDPNLTLSDELTLPNYSALIQKLRTQIDKYNATLSTLDELTRDIKATETLLRDRSERMLAGVAAKYGRNSNEYGKAGGTLKSERRRSTKKKGRGHRRIPRQRERLSANANLRSQNRRSTHLHQRQRLQTHPIRAAIVQPINPKKKHC